MLICAASGLDSLRPSRVLMAAPPLLLREPIHYSTVSSNSNGLSSESAKILLAVSTGLLVYSSELDHYSMTIGHSVHAMTANHNDDHNKLERRALISLCGRLTGINMVY